MIILNIPITIWFFGILAYWWWVFLFKGRRKLRDNDVAHYSKKRNLKPLKSWSTLFDFMLENGGNREEIEEYDKKARRPLIAWFGLQNLLCFWVFGNFWVWTLFQDKLPKNYIIAIWTPGVLIIAMVLLLSPLFLFRLFGTAPDAHLKPLGLSAGEISTDPVMPRLAAGESNGKSRAVIAGKRKGRNILIETTGKYCLTGVEGNTSPFTIESNAGKLAPATHSAKVVKDLIRGFPKAKRWKGITVTGGKEGISIERNSRGTNMWLYDLWLAEQLFEVQT